MTGPPIAVYKCDSPPQPEDPNWTWNVSAAFPVEDGFDPASVSLPAPWLIRELPSGRVSFVGLKIHKAVNMIASASKLTICSEQTVKAVYKGNYSGLPAAWKQIVSNVNEPFKGNETWEQYITDPVSEPDPDNWITHIFIPLL
jgi:hypothetical protein